jgi:hypothetical protein
MEWIAIWQHAISDMIWMSDCAKPVGRIDCPSDRIDYIVLDWKIWHLTSQSPASSTVMKRNKGDDRETRRVFWYELWAEEFDSGQTLPEKWNWCTLFDIPSWKIYGRTGTHQISNLTARNFKISQRLV